MPLQGAIMNGQKQFSMNLRNGVQAACAADLARLAIHGHAPAAAAALNFPASVYTQQQVAAMEVLLQLKRPSMQLAGTKAGSSSSSSSDSVQHEGTPSASGTLLRSADRVKQRAELQAAADAAVADAAAAAAATEAAARFSDNAGDGPPYGTGVDWVKRDRICRMGIFRSGGKKFARIYSRRLHAACAADLAQLALGGTAVNVLPGSLYTPEQVAAMRQLLLFERPAWSTASAGRSKVFAEAQARSAALAELKSAVLDAAAAVVQMAPEQAAAITQAQQVHGCCKRGLGWQVFAYVQITGCTAKRVHVFQSRDATAAACASDLARLAVHRRSAPELNFPEHVYSSEQVAACLPGLRLADAAMHNSSSSGADSSDAASSSSTRDRSSQADAAGA
jgi:hypothetical protein